LRGKEGTSMELWDESGWDSGGGKGVWWRVGGRKAVGDWP
jgi:hypothetical protein